MNILQAIHDEHLFRPYFGTCDKGLGSWRRWATALKVVYGLPVHPKHMKNVQKYTGRSQLPKEGFSTALFLTGRRSGKSRIAALIAAYEATIAQRDKKLMKGEQGVVAVLAPTRRQAKIVKGYIRSAFETPLLKKLIIGETRDGFQLKNGIQIEIMAGDWRTVRGFTLVAAIVDEAAFFGVTEESKVRSDKELIRALLPGLATTNGKLIAISTPYARKGWCYEQYRTCFKEQTGSTLVWNCPSRVMNPTLPRRIVEEALAEDRAAALSEYLGEFRDDVSEYLSRSIVEAAVCKNRKQLMRQHDARYFAFVDLSGGRHDDAALAIGLKKGDKAIVYYQKAYKAPFNPKQVIDQMCQELKAYKVKEVTGDNYAADFVADGFSRNGIKYRKSPKTKSELYLEFLPRICSQQVELLDDDKCISQLARLERRTRSGGRDIIDHPLGTKDDLANAVAGLVSTVHEKIKRAGPLIQN